MSVDLVDPAVLMTMFGIAVALSCAGDLVAARMLVREPITAADAVVGDGELAVSG